MCRMVAPGVEAICAVWLHQEWKQYVLYGGTRSGSNMCCMVAPLVEAIYVLYGGTRSGSNVCCMVAPGVEAICAVWWHQDWKQYVLYGGTRSGSFSTTWYDFSCLNMCWQHHIVSPSQREGWLVKWTQNRSQSHHQATDCVIRILQEVFEACSFPFIRMYPVIYMCC